ncbi:MAG: c-type cytochrome [Halioglobus sp.]
MQTENLAIVLFAAFSLGLPIWGMNHNEPTGNIHGCYGSCYEDWKAATGGAVAIENAAVKARREASPEQLGETAYTGCIACHGTQGEGGIGPRLAGQAAEDIVVKLNQYKKGETLGNQSAIMWSQAGLLEELDIENIAAFLQTL